MAGLKYTTIDTPLGTLYAAATDEGVCMLEFDQKRQKKTLGELEKACDAKAEKGNSPHFGLLKEELAQYFGGKLSEFTVPVALYGSDFQKTVWNTLMLIPYGQTWSYAQQAGKMGRPSAVRAVANANGANKVSIIIPCHRVIASSGNLAGYGGGVWRKEKLIELEKTQQ